jgi:CRISPR-associated protein Cas1
MIKQTLYFGNPAYLSLKHQQLQIIRKKDKGEVITTRPIEDIGVVILDHAQITITHHAIRALQKNKAAIISCDEQHLPSSLMLPIEGNTLQSKVYRHQLAASLSLTKGLWQQTVVAKIQNQIKVLELYGRSTKRLQVLIKRVGSGDPKNIEGQASAYYWARLLPGMKRDQDGDPPNNLLNYGYTIIRSMVARSLVASGLHPTVGIFHKNQYNAYCLVDDIMEPYRPFVDVLVMQIIEGNENLELFLNKSDRVQLLNVMSADAIYGKKRSPLMVGMSMTTASLVHCYQGTKRKLKYPLIPIK